MIALNIKDLTVGYGKRKVVENIVLEAKRGQIICIIGANGTGKSTILRTLAGLLAPIRGVVFLNDLRLEKYDIKDFSKKLGVVLTEKISPGLLTVFDIVAVGRHPYTGFMGQLSNQDLLVVEECIRLVNAEDIAYRYFEELSDGEKQKALLARALAQRPEVLVLDEPTGHLDINHRIELLSILRNLSRDKNLTIIMSLHEVELAVRISDKIVMVKDGSITAVGSPEEVIDENAIKQLYNIKHGRYNDILGNVEIIRELSSADVFVVSGAGSGTPIYRALTRNRIGVCTGVIHNNDVDYYVANSFGIDVVSEKAFETIAETTFLTALEKLKDTRCVVEANYPIGESNAKNIELVTEALKMGKKVYSLRESVRSAGVYGEFSHEIEHFNSLAKLLERLSNQI